jgi:probable F420-dependent oxidoreductase
MAAGNGAVMLGHAARSLGRYGVWRGGQDLSPDLARAIERLGYGALWIGGSPRGKLEQIEDLLAATTTLTLATGIVNIWQDDALTVAASFRRIDARFPGRFLLGVGAGHPEAVEGYAKPYEALTSYVDALLGADVPPGSVALAALGPRVLRLAADRTAGAHPYLVTPEHTRQSRQIMGTGPLLAPEQKVVLGDDPVQARAIGRPRVEKPYLGLTNYTSNLRRLGWTDADLANGGSDALIDALVAHGTPEQAAGRLREHLDAGADHVCVQLLTAPGEDLVVGYQQLASALGL